MEAALAHAHPAPVIEAGSVVVARDVTRRYAAPPRSSPRAVRIVSAADDAAGTLGKTPY